MTSDTPPPAPDPGADPVQLHMLGRRAPPSRPPASAVRIERSERIELASARSADAKPVTIAAADDDVVRVELSDGSILWSRVDDLLREHGRARIGRQGAGGGWSIDAEFMPQRRSDALDAPAARGALAVAISALELFGVDVTGFTATELGRRLERSRLQREPGLYRLDIGAGPPSVIPVAEGDALAPPDVPVLVFLHGTMSSVFGSFGDLLTGQNAGAPEARAELLDRYGRHIYAFEHRSLTESPVANAVDLARRLPQRAQLHLVSHSRGGLIGELLSLAQRERRPEANDAVAEALESRRFAHDHAALAELVRLLDDRAPTVARFVRVACPARGTTLASGRLDRWLSVLGLLAPPGLAADVTDFLLKVVKERTDPRSLPGLEAMMPQSTLTRLLNLPGLVTHADLSVISGDLDPQGRWGKLKLLALDWFYASDHDLVVNTGSMSGGVQRIAGCARQRQARGPAVHHFSYFSNADSLAWLLSGLLRAGTGDAGFGPLDAWSPELEPRSRSALRASQAAADRPMVLVIPGAFGTSLSADGRPVWIDPGALHAGGLRRISIETERIEIGDLIEPLYGTLLEELARSHSVYTLPYDWRRSVRSAATQLLRKLEELLPMAESRGSPLRLVAHSMGGLVARALLAEPDGRATWQRWAALPGSRLLMLGTPNAGSHEAFRWFTGSNPTQARLALLDPTVGIEGTINLVRRFPGLAELLPTGAVAGVHDHHAPAFWTRLRDELGSGPAAPDADVLATARATWHALAGHPLPVQTVNADSPLVVYVAGQQPATVIDHQVVDDPWNGSNGRLQFIATPHGDGSVSWESGRLPGVPMYLARDVAHDELCSHTADADLFAAYRELLETGRTRRLPVLDLGHRSPSAAAGDAALRFVFIEPPPDSLPDPQTLRASSFGARSTRGRKTAQATPRQPLRITVQNRNLKYLDEPLLIGHYASSRLTSTEALVDRQIGGTMSQSLAAGRYPGPPGTHQIFLNRRLDILLPGQLPRPAAAIVVGLGAEGQLRLADLSLTIRQAVIAYAQHRLEQSGPRGMERGIEIAATLIGSGGLGIDTGTAAKAIALGVEQANRQLTLTGSDGWPQVRHLHIVELYRDRATEAFHALQVLASADAGRFALDPELHIDVGAKQRTLDSGYRGSRYDWFSVLTMRDEASHDAPASPTPDAPARRGTIAFTLSTRRARSEVRATRAQWPLLHTLISDASHSANHDRSIGRALFRLVIPAEIETFLGGNSSERATDLVIELDDGTAGIPWELLDARADDDHGMPWSIRTRLLRRLQTQVTDTDPVTHDASADDAILVIGEPEVDASRYGPLPGARQEAHAVVRQLTGAGGIDRSRVHACIAPANGPGPNARCVVTHLLARDYRVLHVAGHGEPGPDGGVVLSQGSVLGPREVRAMRRIPELVFLNCCHLARGADDALLRSPAVDRVSFAAGLARALIGSGVRCVIAAGWAVDDDPAAEFATTFYQDLLSGRRFIDAVNAARLHVWRRFPHSNTWAAYQCYGDPDWVWRKEVGDAQQAAAVPGASLLDGIASASDLALALDNLALDVRFGDQPRQAVLDALALLAARHAEGWGQTGAVADAFGAAYLACGELASAGDWYARALAAGDGSASLKVLDQLANVRARCAAALEPQPARLEIGAAIDLLQRAQAVQSTRERLNLLGSAYKRLALIELDEFDAASAAGAAADPAAVIDALRQCAEHYSAAEQRSGGSSARSSDFYPRLNRIAAETCLDLLCNETPCTSADALGCAGVSDGLQQHNRARADFWSIAGDAELQVIVAVLERRLAQQLPALLRALDDLHERQPAPDQWASVRDQARLVLLTYLRRVTGPEAAAARELLETLERWCRSR